MKENFANFLNFIIKIIQFKISSQEVLISKHHTKNWNFEGGKFILTEPWHHFELFIIGWSDFCKVYSFKENFNNDLDTVTEYVFRMKKVQIEKLLDG